MSPRPLPRGLRHPLAILVLACLTLLTLSQSARVDPTLAWERAAWAQSSNVKISTSAPARAVAGEPFVVELRVVSDDGPVRAENPALTPPIGLGVSQPSVSFFTNSMSMNGVRRSQSEYRARWTIQADEPGTYKIGPASVTVQGDRIRGSAVTVIVEPRGSQPSSPNAPPATASPGSGWPFGIQVDDDEAPVDSTKDLGMRAPPPGRTNLFLRGIPDKTSAVVGEQVTLSYYVYFAVDLDMTERTDPPLQDFLRVQLVRDPGTATPRMAQVGSRTFNVRLLERFAVFPLRAGKLSTGSMSGRFRGRHVGSRVLDQSEDIVIDVTEPPTTGRPPGYAIGDVGAFEIDADVKPRDLEVGGTFAVTVHLKGEGNVPASVRMPRIAGVEWLDPDKTLEQTTRGGKVGGVRTFQYLGKVSRGGYVALGKVDLPVWDPTKKAYVTPSADLGGLRVEGDSVPAPAAPSGSAALPKEDSLASLPAPRTELSPFTATRTQKIPLIPLVLALASPPLLMVILFGGLGAARAARRRAQDKRDAPTTRVKDALDEARAADASSSEKDVAAAVERAIHASLEAHTGVRARGVLLRDLRAELVAAGVDDGVAARAVSVLGDAESLRFDPGADAAKRSGLVERGRELDRALAKDAARRGDEP